MSPNNLTRCVLLASSDDHAEARRHLLDRGWIAHAIGEPLPAMAELCALDRAIEARRAAGGAPADALALVVVDPSRWAALPELLGAARRYVPSAGLWAWRNGALEPLDGLSPAAANDQPLRAYQAPAAPPSISGDEISMLLDGDPPGHTS